MSELYEAFTKWRGRFLGDLGYHVDKSKVEYSSNGYVVFYHYTHADNIEKIFTSDSGLFARLRVYCPNPPEELVDCYLSEGFLEPLPAWLTESPYFGDLGMRLVRNYIGDVLLRIAVPKDFPGLYVSDYAHHLECKHWNLNGSTPLNLGYDCSTGQQVTQAYVNSYIEAVEYKGGHLAPLMQCVRKGQGIVIPNRYITISQFQPFHQ